MAPIKPAPISSKGQAGMGTSPLSPLLGASGVNEFASLALGMPSLSA